MMSSFRRQPAPRANAGSAEQGSSNPGAQRTGIFRVHIPDGVRPGEEFQVYAGHRIVRVRCPPDSHAGQTVQIVVPLGDSPNVRSDPESTGGTQAYVVTIPENVRGGQQFPVTIQGEQLFVTCPLNAHPGMSVRVEIPHHSRPPEMDQRAATGDMTQRFEVEVPPGVLPGKPFALIAAGQRVLVTCPLNARPGQRIRFTLPLTIVDPPFIPLSYDKDVWTRTVRVSDMKFQWVRMDDKGDVDLNKRFDMNRSAYVRKLVFEAGNDPRFRLGQLSLVPATDAVVDSWIKGDDGRDLVSYSDIAKAQVKTFEEKAAWFQSTCGKLCVEWNEGHIRFNIRRQFLLGDSIDAVMSLSRRDMRKLWRFEFIGEVGIDAGGLAREWFQLVTKGIFDPDMGLWQFSAVNQMCMEINPASEYCCDNYLDYYRFLGRVMGKALFDGQLVSGHMVQHLYKHILGWPVTFADLERVDEEYYSNIKQLKDLVESDQDLSLLCLDFTTTREILGTKEEIELIPGGAGIDLDNYNFPEYLEACLKYRMLDRVKPQLNQLLLGFFDVIPEPLLTIFDFQELELLMCGLPEIDIDDWKENTEYSGEYDGIGADHEVCQWFWEVVGELDQETKARLLQFVTGTSGVPARGFGVLQGNDRNIRKFTIHGVYLALCIYPRAHTCFNRIDLPMYQSKEELREKLTVAVTMAPTGFDLE